MRILAIETSCDETAISIIDAGGTLSNTSFHVLGNQLLSQVDLHRKYGGVYPNLAKREHARNLVPLMIETLRDAGLLTPGRIRLDEKKKSELQELLVREPELFEKLCKCIETSGKPDIDVIAVTHGPGLEPALWVGVNFARALSLIWDISVIPVNHMEGHIFAGLLEEVETHRYTISNIDFPILALLISGGHTELVLMREWGEYEVVGSTRDDAVGEAFDKVARLLDLPYPGGPEISKLAEQARKSGLQLEEKLPRPMINSEDLDFSFSGLKTAVLYLTKKTNSTREMKQKIAREFEEAAAEVLIEKSARALEEYGAKVLVVGGGVSANTYIRERLKERLEKEFKEMSLSIPEMSLTTDNAIMIGIAGYYQHLLKRKVALQDIKAEGNLSLANNS